MIKTDKFEPNIDKGEMRRLVSTFIEKKEIPEIKPMKLQKNGEVLATVLFKFYIQETWSGFKGTRKYFTKIIEGTSEDVYKAAAKQSARISLTLERKFREKWNEELMKLLNEPSKDKAKLNINVWKNNKFGLYDIKSPGELLSAKIIQSGLKNKDVANLAGIDEVTLYRHINNQFDINRDMAIIYGKILGCDPAELLFNPLFVPVWASTATLESKSFNNYDVNPCELLVLENEETVKCPREIYRPDVKAIKINQENSMYDNHIAYYYDTHSENYENKLCVVGTILKNKKNQVDRLRYFFGIVQSNKKGLTINIVNPDPDAVYADSYEQDEGFGTFTEVVEAINSDKDVISDIAAEFIYPIVCLVDNGINETKKSEFIKDFGTFYTAARKDNLDEISNLSKLRMRDSLKRRVEDYIDFQYEGSKYHTKDVLENLAIEKTRIFAEANKKFKIILKEIAQNKIKIEKNKPLHSSEVKQIEDLSKKLSAKEEKIVNIAFEEILDEVEAVDYVREPEEEDKIA